MRERAADEADVLKARQPDVGHELATAAQEAVVLLAQEPGTDALAGAGPSVDADSPLRSTPAITAKGTLGNN